MKKTIAILLIFLMLVTSGCMMMKVLLPEPNIEELLEQALECYNAGNYEEAILLYNTVIEIEPRNFKATVGLGKAYRGAGDNGQAVETLRAAYELNGSSSVAFELGCAYIANGQYAKAESLASELWKDGKGSTMGGVILLLSLAAQGETEKVTELLGKEYFTTFLVMGGGTDHLYMGEYDENGRQSGYGLGVYNGCYIYAGEYKDGMRCGQGTWYNCAHQGGYSYYTGEWADDAPNGYGEYHSGYVGNTGISKTIKGNYTNGYEDGEMVMSYEDDVLPYTSNMGIYQLTGEECEVGDGIEYAFAECQVHKGRNKDKCTIAKEDINLRWGIAPWGAEGHITKKD